MCDVWEKNPILVWKCEQGANNSANLKYNHVSVVCFGSDKRWNPIEKIHCGNLVTDLRESLNKRKSSSSCKSLKSINSNKNPCKKLPPSVSSSIRSGRGTDDYTAFQGLVAEAIVGATDARGEVLHLVKWQGREELQLVPALFTTIMFPHIVMAFYVNRVNFVCQSVS